jgi:DNA ligase (NAD+)
VAHVAEFAREVSDAPAIRRHELERMTNLIADASPVRGGGSVRKRHDRIRRFEQFARCTLHELAHELTLRAELDVHLIDRADHAYYNGGQAIMSDAAYDALENELKALAPSDPRLTRVGAPVQSETVLVKRTHSIPMGSQDKATNRAEFDDWLSGLGAGTGGSLHVNFKADGGSAQLEYVNGSLFRAVTRGDGKTGEDITHNVLRCSGLKTFGVIHQGGLFSGFLRAEIVLPISAWKLIDPDLASNPRNLGNGISRRKDGADAEQLQLIAFRAYTSEGLELEKTESAMESAMQAMIPAGPPEGHG